MTVSSSKDVLQFTVHGILRNSKPLTHILPLLSCYAAYIGS